MEFLALNLDFQQKNELVRNYLDKNLTVYEESVAYG